MKQRARIARRADTSSRRWIACALLALGLDLATEMQACNRLERGACPAAFEILAVDPGTLDREVVYRGGGPPMGGGTVGLRVGDELFIGSFAGDRVLRVALQP